MNAKIRYGLSAAVLALIAVGAPAPDILDQFLDEKEGNHTTAYRDGSGIWTICRGATMVDGKPVFPGMKLSKEKCDQVNAIERDKALAWVERNIKVPLTEPQKAGIASIRRQLVLPTRANYTGRTLQCDIKSRLLLPSLSFSCSFHLSVR
ncbi:glycoside hydrolase family protein, partial [Escherichia coli]|uniref:glycoside hydrolase family protein n=1 Tax=Escherichia coli TaxID=562 RepID=UPI00207C8277